MKNWRVRMGWNDVCFLHWRVPVDVLRATLPPGLELDLYDGEAWLSIVPFTMTNVQARGIPVLPGFGRVPEINVRTYVRAGDLDAVWFYSLDAASPLAVEGARLTMSLPYFQATISASQRDGTYTYRSERHDRRAPAGRFDASWRLADDISRAAPGSLDAFLHERYRLMTIRANKLAVATVEHEPWPLQTIDATIAEDTLAWIPGLELPRPPDRASFARSVSVRASGLRPVQASVLEYSGAPRAQSYCPRRDSNPHDLAATGT